MERLCFPKDSLPYSNPGLRLAGPLRQLLFNTLRRVQALLHQLAESNSGSGPALRRDNLKVHQRWFEGITKNLLAAGQQEIREYADESTNCDAARVQRPHRRCERASQYPSGFGDGGAYSGIFAVGINELPQGPVARKIRSGKERTS